MSRAHRPDQPEIPVELAPPPTPEHEVPDLLAVQAGQLIELRDGQRVVVASLVSAGIDAEAHAITQVVRVGWATGSALPLGVSLQLLSTDELAQGPIKILGAWFHEKTVPPVERIVVEAIHRGLITPRTCGVPWPLSPTWQLSEQAATQIERYLFEVARTTGCAFPFHDITAAMRKMHLRQNATQPSLADIVTGESPGRTPRTDDEMLSLWARELHRRVHASDFSILGLPVPPPE